MVRRFVIGIAGTLSGLMLLGTSASAQTNSGTILCGLYNGSNLNFQLGANPCATNAKNTSSAPATPTNSRYVALGDSVAAGLGLSGTYPNDDPRCGRTTQGYPNIVASSLGLQLTNLACSGATTGDLVTRQGVDGPNVPAQLPTAFAAGTPQFMTLTAGANDAHWTGFIRACYVTDCSSAAYTYAARAYLALLSAKLTYGLASIQARSAGSLPQVVVTGYYDPVSGACSGKFAGVTDTELSWIRNETAALNQTIRNAVADFSFVRFAPTDFSGHDICAPQPWVQGLGSSAPFHPTAEGQQAIAASVIAASSNLSH